MFSLLRGLSLHNLEHSPRSFGKDSWGTLLSLPNSPQRLCLSLSPPVSLALTRTPLRAHPQQNRPGRKKNNKKTKTAERLHTFKSVAVWKPNVCFSGSRRRECKKKNEINKKFVVCLSHPLVNSHFHCGAISAEWCFNVYFKNIHRSNLLLWLKGRSQLNALKLNIYFLMMSESPTEAVQFTHSGAKCVSAGRTIICHINFYYLCFFPGVFLFFSFFNFPLIKT